MRAVMGCLNCCPEGEADASPSPISPLLPSRKPYESVEEIEGAPIGKKWYHGGIPDEEAEYRLKSVAEDNGNFLIYNSPRKKGEYVLLVFFDGKCHRWRIARRRDGTYVVGRDGPGVKSYPSVRALVKGHRGLRAKPLQLEHGGSVKLTNYAFVPENTGSSRWRGY